MAPLSHWAKVAITLQRHCLTCANVVPPVGHTALATSLIGVWIIEIAMNTPSRNRATKAIQVHAIASRARSARSLELRTFLNQLNLISIGVLNERDDRTPMFHNTRWSRNAISHDRSTDA